ncbi:hypothetical protein BH09VER1_BH09VER1_13330 [soil metagenome]
MNRFGFRTVQLGRAARCQGVALVLVLGALVLITILVVGLMARALSERKAAASYGAVASARQLSDTVVNLVQAQINDATTQGSTNAWASQPGAIRVFDNGGALRRIYKLYSSSMLTATTSGDLATDLPDGTWNSAPAIWTDINAPVTYNGTNTAFPIIDPRDPTDVTKTVTMGGSFSITNAPAATAAQPAPMPVRWLYVLQNGTLVAPVGSGSTATIAGSDPKTNPIVGRVAFWTDDDTCKININTSGSGTFWDTPHFDASDEKIRAKYQPAQGEFQAYPGHPATTSLATVLSSVGANLYSITPRYSAGGSKGGTAVATGAIARKSDRLYSSIGELLFNPTRGTNGLSRQQLDTARFFLTARSRAPEVNLFGQPRVSIWPLHVTDDVAHRTPTDRVLAFCSTSNGLPYYFARSNPLSATADIGLTRNAALLTYLDTLTSSPIPGFGGKFSAKYGANQKQILTEIFDYIRITNLVDPLLSSPYSTRDLGPQPTKPDIGSLGIVIPSVHPSWGTRGLGRFPVLSEATLLFTGAGKGSQTSPAVAGIPVDSRQGPGYVSSSGTGTMPPADKTAVQAFLLLGFFNPTYGWSGMELGFTVRVSGLESITLNDQTGTPLPRQLNLRSGTLTFAGRSTADFYHGRPYGFVDPRALLTYKRKGDPTPYQYNYTRSLGSDPFTQFAFYSDIVEVGNTPLDSMTVVGGQVTISVYPGRDVDDSKLVQRYVINLPNGSVDVPIPKVPPHPTSQPANSQIAPWLIGASPNPGNFWEDRVDTWYLPGSVTTDNNGPYLINTKYDTIVSVVPTGGWADYRLFALNRDMLTGIPTTAFTLHPGNGPTVPASTLPAKLNVRYGLRLAGAESFPDAFSGNLVAGLKVAGWDNIVPVTVNGAYAGGVGTVPGDWDNGMGKDEAGPYINKADEGNVYNIASVTPYFDDTQNFAATGATFFSPNRQIQSAVMFGSLPSEPLGTSGAPGKPWQTLLFRPGPSGHMGATDPRDHLLLDLFWMPVAEPYAISEPFSTAGKVNMNYQIVPFTYLTRSTALQAVLAGEKVAMEPKALSSTARYPLNLSDTTGTLRQFREKFASGDIFKSATEICDIFLVPSTKFWSNDTDARNGWYSDDFARVGDNVREHPYADIYPRLTTKSNVYTVHYMVQALRQSPSAVAGTWTESATQIAGEYRGSTTLERYIDPNNATIPDYPTAAANSPTLDTFYRWRVIENQQFAP